MKNIASLLLMCFIGFVSQAQSLQNALRFDGNNDFVQTSFPAITGSSARTIEAWIKTSSNSNPSASGIQHVIADMGSFTTGGRFTFNVLWGNAIRLEVGGSGLSGQTAVNDGNWHHVACVYDPNATNKISLYVDGSLDTAGNITTTVNTSMGNMILGKRVDNVRNWEGDIDEVRVWNFAKSISQINALKDEEICASQTGLVAYYRCNQGIANGSNSNITTLIDNSSNSNNGSLTNFNLSGTNSNWVSGTSITSAPNSDSTLNIEACGTYSTPGGTFVTSSGTYTENLSNSLGCDSILTINVTIKNISFKRDTVQACDSFRSTMGTLYSNSRIFNETFTNAVGCDSIVQTFLTISRSTIDTLNVLSCYSYTSPTGNSWNSTGIYTESLTSQEDCDSVVVINLTIADSSTLSIYDTACTQYISPKNNLLTSSGIYREILMNSTGCDSIITLNLVVHPVSDTIISQVICDSFTSASGQNTWFSSGRYTETFINENNCDSTVSFVLDINYSTEGTISVEQCGPFESPDGLLISTTGIYMDVLTNAEGCDSTLTINAKITDNKPKVNKDRDTLIVDLIGLSYQWLDCNENNAKITGATNASYKPEVSGDYAVEVTENNCTDTSLCINYPRTAISSNTFEKQISIMPNPASSYIYIEGLKGNSDIIIINNQGQIVHTSKSSETSKIIDISYFSGGIYFLKVSEHNEYQNITFIKGP